jgi:hypothetical protein
MYSILIVRLVLVCDMLGFLVVGDGSSVTPFSGSSAYDDSLSLDMVNNE